MKQLFYRLLPSPMAAFDMVILLTASIVAATAINWIQPQGISLLEKCKVAVAQSTKPLPKTMQENKVELNYDESFQLFEKGVTFVDARSRDHYNEKHIKGAVPLPNEEAPELISEFSEKYPLDQMLVLYCTSEDCPLSHELKNFLVEFGYTNLRLYVGGIDEWVEKNAPVEGDE